MDTGWVEPTSPGGGWRLKKLIRHQRRSDVGAANSSSTNLAGVLLKLDNAETNKQIQTFKPSQDLGETE